MKPVFDGNGLATEPGEIRCFYYDPVTYEYMGWSDEYINIGVSMPGYSTDIGPIEEVTGKIAVFSNGEWVLSEDHRGIIVYSTDDGSTSIVDYIGSVREGYTTIPPSGAFQKWGGENWVTDTDALHGADVRVAEKKKAELLGDAQKIISLWQTELQLGIISDEDKADLISWVSYIKELKNVDTSLTSAIEWPNKP